MKKLLSIILAVTTLVSSVSVMAESYGNYPAHVEFVSDPSGWVNNDGMAVGASPAENVFYVEDDNGELRSFVLLDKDAEGNYFVITEENYGTHQYTDYLYSDILTMNDSEWVFDPENEKSVAYWLENDFWNNGNGGIALPTPIKNNILTKDWQIENNYTTNEVSEGHEKYSQVQEWIANRAPLRTVNSKLSLMSWTEYKTYKNKISPNLQQYNATWTGMMMRSVRSRVIEKGADVEYRHHIAFLGASEDSGYEWIGYMNIWNNGYPRGKFDGDLSYADGDTSTYFYIRPVFWLDKDFFKNVKIDLSQSGINTVDEIKNLYTAEDLTGIYTDDEIVSIFGEDEELSNYPTHTEIASDPSGWVNNADMTIGASPAENVFYVEDDNGELRSFVLLDKDAEGNYFVITEENYGTHQYTDYLYSDILTMNDSEWVFDPENEKSVAYWLENDFWNNGNGGIALPTPIKNNILTKDWQIENNYTTNEVSEGHEKYSQVQEWIANRAPLRTVNSKLSLMSWTEYKTYKNKISPQLQQYNATWTGMMMRSVRSRVIEKGADVEYRHHIAFLGASEDSGYEWIGYMNIWNNGYPRGKFDGDLSYADGDSSTYFYIRPVFWLDKDFFGNEKVNIAKSGKNVIAKIRERYTAEELENLYTDEEIEIIFRTVRDFGLTDSVGEEVTKGAAYSSDGKLYLNISVDNVTNSTENIMTAIARYKNDRLDSIAQQSFVVQAGETLDVGAGLSNELSIDSDNSIDVSYKIFVWDSDTMTPYTDAKTYYAGNEIEVLYNNKVYEFASQPAVETNSAVYVPVSEFAKKVGYTAQNHAEALVLSGNGNIVQLTEKNVTVNGESVAVDNFPVKREQDYLVTVDTITAILPIGEDITANENGIALHKEYYSDDTTFFNIATTFSGDAKTERGFTWEAMPRYNDMVIEYAENSALIDALQIQAEYERYPVIYNYDISYATEDEISFYDNMLFYKVKIDGLKPGTTYSYRVGDKTKNEWSEIYTFTTEAENTDSFSLITVADSQAYTPDTFDYYKQALDAAAADCEDASFLVHMGDITENGMCDDWWNMHFNASKGMCETLPTVTVIGNHEERAFGAKYYNLHYFNPKNASGLADSFDYSKANKYEVPTIENLDNTVYSFDYGDAHFAVLNSGSDWGTKDLMVDLQKEWLKEDMSKSTKKWKILLIHIGVYSGSTSDSLTHSLYSVIDECDIDFVMQGHSHYWMRTKPMRNNTFTESENPNVICHADGTVYGLMGLSGYHESGNLPQNDYIEVVKGIEKGNPSYSIVSFDSEKISVMAKTLDGTVIDEFIITK